MDGMRFRSAAGVLAVALLAGLTLVACGGSGGSSPSPTAAQVKAYTATASGSTVSAAVGDRIVIKLDENPSTGYRWRLKLGPGLKLLKDTFVGPSYSPSPSPAIVGAGGVRSWLVEVEKPGVLTITGAYFRPWESASKSAERFALTISAK
jgi:inhibitor of cysteine peptidase